MISIIDISSKRIIKILQLFLQNQDWLTVKQIASELNVSEKTINDDLKLIKDNWESTISLTSSFTQGIKAPNLSVSNLIDIQSEILLSSVSIKFIKALFYYPNEHLNVYADKLHVSRSTLYRYLPNINQYLNQYSIDIKSDHSSYQVVAKDELKLRRFFSIFLFELSGYNLKRFIPKEELDFFYHRVKKIYLDHNEPLADIQLPIYASYYFVSLKREEQGFNHHRKNYFTGESTCFDDKEKEFVSQHFKHLTLKNLTETEKNILAFRSSLNSHYDEKITETISFKINEFLTEFHLDTNNLEENYLAVSLSDLYINEKYINIPYYLFTNRFTYFAHQTSIQNRATYDKILRFTEELSKEINVDFNKHLDFIIYLLITSQPELIQTQFQKKTLVISNNSQKHAEFLSSIIQTKMNIAPHYFNDINSISKRDMALYDLNSFDLIITNSVEVNQQVNSLLMNDFPTEQNIQELETLLKNG